MTPQHSHAVFCEGCAQPLGGEPVMEVAYVRNERRPEVAPRVTFHRRCWDKVGSGGWYEELP